MQTLLGGLSGQESSRTQSALDTIREAMLQGLSAGAGEAFPVVQLRVTYANDLQDLWYLRGDVMAAIAAIDGEASAKRRLAQISDMFKGLLPRGLTSRPSPLGEH